MHHLSRIKRELLLALAGDSLPDSLQRRFILPLPLSSSSPAPPGTGGTEYPWRRRTGTG